MVKILAQENSSDLNEMQMYFSLLRLDGIYRVMRF